MSTKEKISSDRDIHVLAGLSAGLKNEYLARSNTWVGSPFEWILSRPSRQKGKIGEQLIAGWCAARELNVVRSPDSDADRIIEGHRVEIKFSTRWENGLYTFQQIRDQDYEYLICLGISPFDAHAWIFRKSDIPFQTLKHQHGGSRGRDTWWLQFKADTPPEWMKAQNGTLAYVYDVLSGGGRMEP